MAYRFTIKKRKADKINPYQVNVNGQYWSKHQTKSAAIQMQKKLRKTNK